MADDAASPGRPVTDGPATSDTGDEQPDDVIDDVQLQIEPTPLVPEVMPPTRTARAAVVSLAAVVALAGLTGWLVVGAVQAHQVEQKRATFLAVGRQAALNLTTINHNDADAAIKRILDISAGPFREDFQQRAEPFVQVVKQSQSDSEGTVTEAGLESVDGDHAQVVVSVSVKTTSPGAGAQPPRLWRMRLDVERTGNDTKVSKVGFVQ
jgi:Mce-associated membrane protein